jgi:hydroxypyruvate isomerase
LSNPIFVQNLFWNLSVLIFVLEPGKKRAYSCLKFNCCNCTEFENIFLWKGLVMSEIKQSKNLNNNRMSRRNVLRMVAGTSAAGAAAMSFSSCATTGVSLKPAATKGRINHSIAHWCFAEYWSLEKMCQVARQLGCKSIELVGPNDFATLKKYGLACALAPNGTPDPPFVKGFNNLKYHDMIIAKTRETIDACAEYNFPNVIAFTGYRENIPNDVGAKNCVTGLKKIMGYAERKKVNLCLEILNSRVDEEMKGHPGYQGDHTDYVMEIVKKVGSPRMKLLFDIYHVQVMDGDVISRIREYKDYVGHYHTAGSPGRGEIGDNQEINYRAIMKEIVKTGYKGYVGHEFVPTRKPLEGLTEAVTICDV